MMFRIVLSDGQLATLKQRMEGIAVITYGAEGVDVVSDDPAKAERVALDALVDILPADDTEAVDIPLPALRKKALVDKRPVRYATTVRRAAA